MAAPSSIVPVMASKTKTKKKHFVAQKVKLFRASDPLLSVLMWGVNHSVSAAARTTARPPRRGITPPPRGCGGGGDAGLVRGGRDRGRHVLPGAARRSSPSAPAGGRGVQGKSGRGAPGEAAVSCRGGGDARRGACGSPCPIDPRSRSLNSVRVVPVRGRGCERSRSRSRSAPAATRERALHKGTAVKKPEEPARHQNQATPQNPVTGV